MTQTAARLLFLLLLLGSFPQQGSAQQPPNCGSCVCAISSLGMGASLLTPLPNCGLSSTLTLPPLQYGFINVSPNRQYTFSVCSGTTENTLIYLTNNNTGNTVIGGANAYGCDDDGCGFVNGPSRTTVVFPSGGQYRIFVFRDACGTARLSDVTVTITTFCPPAPANDDPCFVDPAYAVDLSGPLVETCNYIEATTLGATGSAGFLALAPSCFTGSGLSVANGDYVLGDVWFRAVVPASGRIAIETEELGICAGAFALYRNTVACPGPGTWSHLYPTAGYTPYGCSLVGADGTESPAAGHYSGLTPGETIYVRYWERGNNEPGTFRLCIYEPAAAAGDAPCTAEPLVALIDNCTFTLYTNVRSSPFGGTPAVPNPTVGNCGSEIFPAMFETWFAIPVTADMVSNGLVVDTEAGSLSDLAMEWFSASGSCPSTLSLTPLFCNNDQNAPTNLMPRLNRQLPGAMIGQTLYVRIWSRRYGTFGICASENVPPVNDNPCGAIDLPTTFGGCNPMDATNAAATVTGGSFPGGTAVNPTCYPSGPYNSDVWYRVQVPPNGQVRIVSGAGELTSTNMQLYRSGVSACPSLTLTTAGLPGAACSTSATGVASLSVDLNPLFFAGEYLYLRVWRRANVADGSFTLCSYRTDAPAGTCPDVSADSGGPTANYSNNENFVQTFCPVSPTDVVHLSFSQFNTEQDLDVLQIFDGNSVIEPCLGRFSGTQLPGQFVGTSAGGCITVRFTSNASGTRPGWVAAVNCVPALPEVLCGTLSLSDPGGNCSNYGNGLNVISAPGSICALPGEVPILTFSEFNLAANDYLIVYDGNDQFAPCLGTFTGNALPPVLYGTVPGGCLTTRLTSNGFGNAAGYSATLSSGAAPTAPTIYVASTSGGTISPVACNARIFDSGGACGQYLNNENWTTTYCAPPGQYLYMDFRAFELENTYDRLRIYDGPNTGSPLLGNYTGTGSPGALVSTGNCITLQFTSDYSVVRNGWVANLTCVTTPGGPPGPSVGVCGSVVLDPGGTGFGYPTYLGNPPGSAWTALYCPDASLPAGSTVTLDFTAFNVEAVFDALYIYDSNFADPGALISSGNGAPSTSFGGSGGPGGWWGGIGPGTITATNPSGCLFLEFHTDNSVSGNWSNAANPGWEATVTCNEPPGPPPPVPDCYYVLRLFDSCADGWGSSSVGVSVNGGTTTRYTLPTGSFAQYMIPVDINDPVLLTYDGSGPNSGNNSYTFGPSDSPFATYYSGSPIGLAPVAITVDCAPPPAPPEDCVGAFTLCNNTTFNATTTHTGSYADLNSTNRGCVSTNESQGIWYVFSSETNGSLGFTLTPINAGDDYNFAVWGPHDPGSLTNTICPLDDPPVRCSYATSLGTTGMAGGSSPGFANPFPAFNEGSAGSRWVPGLNVTADQVWLLYVSNKSGTGQGVNLVWNIVDADLNCTILPVELLSFDAEASGDHVDVTWSTATELNSSHFIVERSADGEHFLPIGRVAAAGESMVTLDYGFVDSEPLLGVSYYRLEQMDRDGSTKYSDKVPVQFNPGQRGLELYPNPAVDRVRVLFDVPSEGQVRWTITDASGRRADDGVFGSAKGRNGMDIEVSKLETGTYLLQLYGTKEGPIGQARFVKQH